ncbi:MAG: histidine--tRNA ligase [Hyphomicrobiales bacterium]|nr:histidine--tRNA ligase [Hyphomicrobiales bacterium]MDE2017929.1 histidine--tRNA ligase [Hyphomicrobiales bacterium]
MSDTPKKTEARLPRGFLDRGAADLAATDALCAKIREVYSLYGFEPVETPFLEYTDALGKFLPDQDRPNEGVFSLQDDDDQWMSLRYDLTAPLARHVAEHWDRLPKPYRSQRAGWVFRNEKPGPGRFRQFMQFDADIVGSASPAADAEICMMAADTLEALGFKRGEYVVKVNNRKILDGVLEAMGLGGDANAARRLVAIRAIDKLDRLGVEGVRALLGTGRKDESGDITEGANLTPQQIDMIINVVQATDIGTLREILDQLTINTNGVPDQYGGLPRLPYFDAFFESIEQLMPLVRRAGYEADRIRFDPSVVRGLEYYTGAVFEAEVGLKDAEGKRISFGSVGGGGRYDGLVSRFRAEPVPATGFSVGVSRLQAALRAAGSPLVAGAAKSGPVLVTVFDRDQLGDYQAFAATLRKAGIAAEVYLGASGLNAQLKYADRRGCRCAIIQGSDERARNEVTIRDLVLGAELAKADKSRADHLDLRKKAQFAAPVDGLVAAVREVLARG